MALMNGYKLQEGSRSNTALVKSGHASPAEKWILDPTFGQKEMSGIYRDGVLLTYIYGGPGTEDVTIPKGRVVGVGKNVHDFVSGNRYTCMTLPGMTLNKNVIGMVPYNITKDWLQFDRLGGNQPSILTMEYVELPILKGFEPEKAYTMQGVIAEEQAISIGNRMPWGAVIGDIANGDYVKASPSGRLCKWDSTKDSPMDVVGQVLATDMNFEREGWLKWLLEEAQYKKEDDTVMNRSGASNMPSDDGYPFDPTYPEGDTIWNQYQSQFIDNPTGMIGIHDGRGNYSGYGRNDTEYKDMEIGVIPAGTKAGTQVQLQAVDYAGGKIQNIQEGVIVNVGGTQVAADKLSISYKKAIITITLAEDVTSETTVTATYKALHYGTPAWMDFKGVVGAASVLLMK